MILARGRVPVSASGFFQASLTCLRLGVLGNGTQPVDYIDDKVLLQGEVGVANTLRAVDDEDHIQSTAALLAVWKCL